jgi:predicted enzyme related to lactoylglutathione lyase
MVHISTKDIKTSWILILKNRNVYTITSPATIMKDAITWFDIPTENFDRAVKFYSDILGQPIRVDTFMGQKFGFFPMDGTEGVGGALVLPRWAKPCADGTRVYLSCQGIIDEVIGRVEKSGGKIIAPKFELGDRGWIAVIMDTEGNTVGLQSYK